MYDTTAVCMICGVLKMVSKFTAVAAILAINSTCMYYKQYLQQYPATAVPHLIRRLRRLVHDHPSATLNRRTPDNLRGEDLKE